MKFYCMKPTYTLLLGLFILLCSFDAAAQDPYFSQYYAAPLQVNPAMTGVYEGRFRAVVNYRQQWGSVLGTNPFRTVGASFDMRYRIGRGDYLAYGFNFLHDEVGQANFSQDKGYLNLAYMKQLGGGRYSTVDQYLIAGVQVGGNQVSVDFGNLWFSSQFDASSASIDFTASNQEAMLTAVNQTYFDANVGLLWYALFDDNMSLYAGGAMHHVNSPKLSFLGDNSVEVYRRYTGQVGGEIPLSRKELSLLPSAIFMSQGPSFISIFGGNFRYTNRDWREIAIRAGMWGHLANNVDGAGFSNMIFTAILELEKVDIGISYDVNTGRVSQPTNGRGGFELSMQYKHPARSRYKVNCPKF